MCERPCAQPRRGAPLGHKRAERQVPRRGTLNAPWENEVPLRGTGAETIAVTKRRASPMQQCWVECQCSVEHHVLRFAQLTFWHLPEPFGVAWSSMLQSKQMDHFNFYLTMLRFNTLLVPVFLAQTIRTQSTPVRCGLDSPIRQPSIR